MAPLNTDPPKDPKLQRKRLHVSIWYVIGVILLVLTLQTYFTEQQSHVTYAEFRQLVRDDKVDTAVISPSGAIKGQLRPESGSTTGRPYRTERGGIEDKDLLNLLEQHKVKAEGEREGMMGEIFLAWILPLGIMAAFWFLLMRRMGGGPETVLNLGKSKAKIYAETDVKVTFKDVAGVDEAVEEVREIVEFLRNPDKFKRLGAQIPKGILLVGFPGTGKTLLARALAGEAKVPFFHMSGSDFVEMFAGLGAARVRDLFKQAKEKAPCIIFVDELDALGKTRTMSAIGSHEEREQTLNALLVEMDGFEPNTGVVLIGATNRPEILDAALLRPGRFDRQVVVDRPDQKGRLDILDVHAKGKKLAADVELKTVAQRTVGMVGADLAAVLNEAALLAGRKGREEVHRYDIDEAIDRVQAGLEKKKRMLTPKEKDIVAYHESGHALCTLLLPTAEKSLHKVSIIPRGPAALGLTWMKQAEDRYIMSRNELEDQLVVSLGGRAAEEIIFGEISSGAANDIEKVTEMARRMVVELGMSDRIGLIHYDGDRRARFLDLGGPERTYSEETAREIDLEVKRIIDRAHGRAKDLLSENRPTLERMAKRLLEAEVIDREELDRIMKESTAPAPAAPAAASGTPKPAA
jgi:cell division protease FtsH